MSSKKCVGVICGLMACVLSVGVGMAQQACTHLPGGVPPEECFVSTGQGVYNGTEISMAYRVTPLFGVQGMMTQYDIVWCLDKPVAYPITVSLTAPTNNL